MGEGFKSLKVWQVAKDLAVSVYKLTESGNISRDYGLRDQIRRSSVSVCSNIAEGDERGSNRDSVRFFYIAKGSLAELITQLEIALEVGYLQQDELAELEKVCSDLGKSLGALIKARVN